MLRLDGFRTTALANPLFLIFNLRQPIDHLPAAFLEVGGSGVNARIVFRAAQRALSFNGLTSLSMAEGSHELYHPILILSSRRVALESRRFKTSPWTKSPPGGAYALRYLREG